MGDAAARQLVARTVRVTPSKQRQHNESSVRTSSRPFVPRNPALRSHHLKSVFPGGFNLAKFRTQPLRHIAQPAPEPASPTTKYEEYKGPDPSECAVDPAALDWLRPVDVDYAPGSFEECEVAVQAVRTTEHVLRLPQPAFEPETSLCRFRPSAVFEAVDKPARGAQQVPEPAPPPRSRTHSSAALHLPSAQANASASALHVIEGCARTADEHTSNDDEECVDVTAFITDERAQGLPQLLGTMNVKRRTSRSELHAELSRMLAGVGPREATALTGDEALFLRDPGSRTWKPLTDSLVVELPNSGELELLYSCRSVTEQSPPQQQQQQQPEGHTSPSKTSGCSPARTQLLNALVDIEPRSSAAQPTFSSTKAKRYPSSPARRRQSPTHAVSSPFMPFLPPSPSAEQQDQQEDSCGTVTSSWSSASRAKRQAVRERQRKMACKLQDRLRHAAVADASPSEDLQDGTSVFTQQSSTRTRQFLELFFQT